MTLRVSINGFGRIGRLVLRSIIELNRQNIEVVAINDLGSAAANAHLLQYDSVHGRLHADIKADADALIINGRKIKILAERDPAKLPWRELNIDVALECTGIFTAADQAKAHLQAGAKRVLVSAPSEGADLTVVYGVNHQKLASTHKIVSNGSCTTNCLAPVAQIIHQLCGIKHGFMTTIHAYTGDQNTVDTLHKDLRRARAAALSMIPSSTGAAKAIGLVLPELQGKLDGTSVRVPTPNVSLVDLKVVCERPTTIQAVNQAMKAAADGYLKGILGYNEAELVSVDFNHDAHSSTFDATQTKIIDGSLLRVVSWYDNEWGFSTRMADIALEIGHYL